ncbi:hypothetical protein A1O7_00580 [Cladophialophora yegresii CBS 114405]|uniref:Heterokaryon incompatibility domain-containing protein n=1 Tax=Cladophialophora yegresii CBS 114405 TaxID=1182544 RepID=W9X178_9EURO|nr:uncharacterized protein A1O7_00580 [Cladophialophora yegresii CBS 114405]EXJ64244.1 hypothetical protein A1O7_00580 [Cladophialophora yegresii CBS 114405]
MDIVQAPPCGESAVDSSFQNLEHFRYFSTYESLNKHTRELRILTLLPRQENDDVITCSLAKVPLSAANHFYALSHCWGSPGETAKIMVNGERFHIRKNLRNFLWNLRKLFPGPVTVWVDFLCINQHDILERNFEVSVMGEIYASADKVIAWLGDSTPESEEALNYLNEISRLRQQRGEEVVVRYSDKTPTRALKHLMSRPYWSRLWIVQEVLLANDALTMYPAWTL